MIAKPYITVVMPDKSKWAVPAHIVADDRAKYYAERDTDTTYEAEYKFTLETDYELTDWAVNNMNWDEVEKHAVQLPKQPLSAEDFQDGWMCGEKEVVR